MIKVIETIVVLTLLLFSFFVGVKYSDQVKERAMWIFETKEAEIDLPEMMPDLNDDKQLNQEIIIDDGLQNKSPEELIDTESLELDSQSIEDSIEDLKEIQQ